jgi:hypothetical protein
VAPFPAKARGRARPQPAARLSPDPVSPRHTGYGTGMALAFNAAMALIAQVEPGGRGGNPDESVGLVTILVIAALVLAAGLVLAYVFTRGRARRRSLERRPDSSGRVGRVSKMRD